MTARDDPIEALQALGYGEREARFLYVVAAHSGYFLRRQYEAFTGLARGASASRFLRRALAAKHIRSIPHSNRTDVFHLFSRPVYRAIGAEDNRNRRQRPHYSVKAKVMTLDFVLARRDRRFLATEQEKLEHFVGARGIDRDRLPGKTYTAKSSGAMTRSYFIEKSPIYFEPDEGSPVPSFCYVDEGALSTSGFMSFLNRYRPLFASLRRFRLTYVAAEHRPFRRALCVFERFETSLDHPEELLPSGLLGDYFLLRFYLESRQYHLLDKAKLDRLRTLADRFQHPSAEKKFREWADEMAMSRSSEPVGADFELHRLYHRYDIFCPLPASRRAQVGRERPPVFGCWSAQTPPGCASGRSRPTCATVDIADDLDSDRDVDAIDDVRVDKRRDRFEHDLADTSLNIDVVADVHCRRDTIGPRRQMSLPTLCRFGREGNHRGRARIRHSRRCAISFKPSLR